jgi:multidrug efflux pump
VASAVAVSGFVALTLTPMMCSKILKEHERHGGLYLAMERFFAAMTQGYRRAVAFTLKKSLIPIGVFALVVGATAFLVTQLRQELSPLEDRGYFLTLINAPEGASMEYTDGYVRAVERMYAEVPEIRSMFAVVAPGLERPNPVNFGVTFTQLAPWEERERKTQQITATMAPKLSAALPGVLAFPVNPNSLGQGFRTPQVQYVVQGNSYEELDAAVDKLLARARESGAIVNADSDLKLNKPQLAVDIDREKAANVGVEVEVIGRTLETLLGGRQVTRFKREGKQYDVMVQLEAKDRNTPADLTSIYVRARDGSLVQLSNLVRVRETVAAKELNHFNRSRAAIISANVAPGSTLGEALDFLDRASAEVLSSSFRSDLDGVSREFRESGAGLVFVILFAALFIYLMLSAQFESFVSPFVIMLTVPLAGLGALLAIYLTGGTLNVYSKVGLVMLIGLITKHGILIVEFANQLRDRGMDAADAVVEAATLRLRPILMTTGAMVLGALPLALAMGAGAEARQAIGWVIVGGLLLGTLFTLFVIPTAYLLLVRRRARTPFLQADAVKTA